MGIQDGNETGVDITSTGTLEQFEPTGRFVLDITLTATSSIDVEVQVTDSDETSWETSNTYSSVTSINDSLEGSATKVRVQLTTSATSGTADYYIGCGD